MENPIFIVGLPRSGSTLWLNIFAKNPKIFRMGEMLFLTPWRKDFRYFIRRHVGDLSIEKNMKKMIELIFSREKISGIAGSFWDYDIEKVNDPNLRNKLLHKISESDKSLESIFKIMIEEITRFSGYSRSCVKFPVYANHVPKLLKWFPSCKVVHITRDPRAIAMSKTNDPGGTAKMIEKHPRLGLPIRKIMIFFVILQYIWTSKLHRKYRHFQNYALFKYEDLLAAPEKTIKKLCEFTNIDFVPEMLSPQKGKEKGQISSLTGKRQEGFDKKAVSRWTTIISPFDKIVISSLTRGSMKRFGYDPKKLLHSH